MARLIVLIAVVILCGCAASKRSVRQMSVDLGVDVYDGVYPSAGVSVPVGPVWLSTGLWTGWDYANGDHAWGPYVTAGWSWSPFAGENSGNASNKSRRDPKVR
jgi:hypothetical protein